MLKCVGECLRARVLKVDVKMARHSSPAVEPLFDVFREAGPLASLLDVAHVHVRSDQYEPAFDAERTHELGAIIWRIHGVRNPRISPDRRHGIDGRTHVREGHQVQEDEHDVDARIPSQALAWRGVK